MWCDEINEKYTELHPLIDGKRWWYHISTKAFEQRRWADTDQRRPVPWPARDDRTLDLTVQLLDEVVNGKWPDCDWYYAHPFEYPLVVAFTLRNLVDPTDSPETSYFRSGRKMPTEIQRKFLRVAAGLLAAKRGEFGSEPDRYPEYNDIVVALAQIAIVSPVLDSLSVQWWIWAFGGPRGGATIRARAFATKVLNAYYNRNPNLVTKSLVDQINKLSASIQRLPPPRNYQEEKERQLFASDATSLAASIAAILASRDLAVVAPSFDDVSRFTPPGTRAPGTFIYPRWLPVAGAVTVSSLLLGLVLALSSKRRKRM